MKWMSDQHTHHMPEGQVAIEGKTTRRWIYSTDASFPGQAIKLSSELRVMATVHVLQLTQCHTRFVKGSVVSDDGLEVRNHIDSSGACKSSWSSIQPA